MEKKVTMLSFKVFGIGLIIFLCAFTSSIALAADQNELLKRLNHLQNKLMEQQQMIDQL